MKLKLDTERFLRRHWQQRPLLVRAAVDPDSCAAMQQLGPATLRELARSDDARSRLVRAPDATGQWSLDHGPFQRLPSSGAVRRPWTLLVQGVEQHHDAARRMLDAFRFIADARIDDLMCSLACAGGGVGPHVDAYDVFLVQLQGRRRWSIAPPARSHRALPEQPIRVIAPFEPSAQWDLEPGDMLYLPPQWAHEGVALDECVTASVGFRAPSRNETLAAFHGWLADALAGDPPLNDPRFTDPNPRPLRHPARIPDAMVETLSDWILRERHDPARLLGFIGSHLSEPAPSVWFESREDGATLPPAVLELARGTRLLYHGQLAFINGECLTVPSRARAHLRTLANARRLNAAEAAAACENSWMRERLVEWWQNGWIDAAQGSD